MKKFLTKIFMFIIPIVIYSIIAMIAMPSLIALKNGPSTRQQITKSFENSLKRNYQLFVLGNSRTYRGINPDEFTLECFNFSHDNDSYNQIYYKLKFLMENKKSFKYLILGVDYFQFSFKSAKRNYVYADFLGNDYLKDFANRSILRQKLSNYLEKINPKNLLLLFNSKNNAPFLRENGQYIVKGKARDNDTLKRKINRLYFQENYFKKIIHLCKSNKIKVFMVMLPTRKNELSSYSNFDIIEFNAFIDKHADNTNVFYLNYSTINDFKTKDYSDITHFNESAASRFSIILNRDLLKLIKQKKRPK